MTATWRACTAFELAPLRPDYISVTYGGRLERRASLRINAPRAPGITPLRISPASGRTTRSGRSWTGGKWGAEHPGFAGDPPKGAERFERHPQDSHADELVASSGSTTGSSAALSGEAPRGARRRRIRAPEGEGGGRRRLPRVADVFENEAYFRFVAALRRGDRGADPARRHAVLTPKFSRATGECSPRGARTAPKA